VSVIIPALNEAQNLPSVLGALPDDVHEVVLVDGHSTDETVDVARRHRPDIRVVQQTRRGKGNALACGFAAATGDIVIMLDADGSADPKEIPVFVDALLAGAHFAKGSRFIGHGGSADITRLRRAGNGLLNLCVRAFFRVGFTDLCYGYNAFWSECLMILELSEPVIEVPAGEQVDRRRTSAAVRWGDGFEIETLINVRIQQAGLSVVEVPSFEHPRLHGVSNLNAVRDGLRVLRTIAAEWRRLRRAAQTRPAAGAVRKVGEPWDAFAAGERRRPIEVPATRRGDRRDGAPAAGRAQR
jgi:glycosyltransferase involved in cell wall biosynthesis